MTLSPYQKLKKSQKNEILLVDSKLFLENISDVLNYLIALLSDWVKRMCRIHVKNSFKSTQNVDT